MNNDLAGIGISAAVVAGVALLVVLSVVVGAMVIDGATTFTIDADEDEPTDGPPSEYEPDAIIAEPIPSDGEVVVDESLYAESLDERRLVVIERGNTIQQEDIRTLVEAIVRAGHEVRFRDNDGLDEVLPEADAYVRVAPDNALSQEELMLVDRFADQGGRVVILGEPNRKRISVSAFGASISDVRLETTGLAAQYGVVFETRYLYDTTTNDGNFRHVLAEPTDAEAAPELDQVALYTATAVSVRPGLNSTSFTDSVTRPPNGTVLLRTSSSARLDNGGEQAAYPVAVRSGPLLAVGDTNFLRGGQHNVADNEVLIAHVTEFMLQGDRPTGVNITTTNTGEGGPDGPSGSSGPGGV